MHLKSLLEWYDVFDPYVMIDDHCYDGNHINDIIDLTDKWIEITKKELPLETKRWCDSRWVLQTY